MWYPYGSCPAAPGECKAVEAVPDTCDVLNGAPGQTVLLSLTVSEMSVMFFPCGYVICSVLIATIFAWFSYWVECVLWRENPLIPFNDLEQMGVLASSPWASYLF